MTASLAGASWIRKMYDEGERLRAEFGANAIADLSLGNPTLEPPAAYHAALIAVLNEASVGAHRYMPNAGFPETRAAVATNASREFAMPFEARHIVMTVGTAGAVNLALKALLDEGDEVIILSPYFTEYPYYVANHGAKAVVVPTDADFFPDCDAIARAIGPRTRVLLLNSPNNPTGRVYGADLLARLGETLKAATRRIVREHDHVHDDDDERNGITIIADDPYRRLVYDGRKAPNIFAAYDELILCTSYSKDLSIPGERIGYAAVSPRSAHVDDIVPALAFCNRALGFVNAPALQQRVVARLGDVAVDTAVYQQKRDRLVAALRALGHHYAPPEGAFYLFLEAPARDDIAFTRRLMAERTLVVPGTGFGTPGWVRIAYCVDDASLDRGIAAFERVAKAP